MKYAGILGALAVAIGGAPTGTDQQALIDQIEWNVKMPEEAFPLDRYRRSYAMKDRRTVIGVYELVGPATDLALLRPVGSTIAHRRWVEADQLPSMEDGGCDFITVVLDLRTNIISASCNGVA